jgi:hypothetical protein
MIAVLVLALAGPLVAQTGAGAPAGSQPPNDAPAAANAAKAPAAGQRILNPESLAARLMLATPEQRQRALALLPPERQEQIRKQLEWFDSLPKAQQDVQIRRLERFASLPPGQQAIVRLRMQAFAKLPPARRQAIQRALVLLQTLTRDRRAALMNSPAFRSRFSPDEQKIIEDLSDAWLLPPAQPSPVSPK